MIKVVGRHVVIEVRCTSIEKSPHKILTKALMKFVML